MDDIVYAYDIHIPGANVERIKERVIEAVALEFGKRIFSGDSNTFLVKPILYDEEDYTGKRTIAAKIRVVNPYKVGFRDIGFFSRFCKFCGAPINGLICGICKRG